MATACPLPSLKQGADNSLKAEDAVAVSHDRQDEPASSDGRCPGGDPLVKLVELLLRLGRVADPIPSYASGPHRFELGSHFRRGIARDGSAFRTS